MQRYKKRGVIVIGKETWLTFLVFLLMFVSNDTYQFGTNINYRMTTYPWHLMVVFIVIASLQVFTHHLNRYQRRVLTYGMAFVLLFVALAAYHHEYFQVASVRLLCIVSSMLFVMQYSYKDYEDAFIKVMSFFALTALILEIICYFFHGLALSLPRMMNTAGVQITTIGFAGIDSRNLDALLIRNSGIFWEPGVFQMYLNLALMMELFRKQTIRMKYVVLLTLGVLITFSTTGYIVYAWIVATYFLLSKKNKLTGKTLLSMTAVLVIIVAAVNLIDLSVLNTTVFGKLFDTDSGSTIARKASVYVNLQMFLSHPMTGVGMRNIQDELIQRSLLMFGRSTTHNTNTLLYQFAAFGLIYGALFTLGTFSFTKLFSDKKILRIALFIGLVLIYVGENLRSSMLPYLLIFYGFGVMEEYKDAYEE